jgi:hypothetical protein
LNSNNSNTEKKVRSALIVALILVTGVTGFFAYSYSQERGIASSQASQISSLSSEYSSLQGQVSGLESKVNSDNNVISILNSTDNSIISSLEAQVAIDNSTIQKLETGSFLNFTVMSMRATAGENGNTSVFLEIKNTGTLGISNTSVFAQVSANSPSISASFTPASMSPGESASVNFTVPSAQAGAKIFLSVTAIGPSATADMEYFGVTATLAVVAS